MPGGGGIETDLPFAGRTARVVLLGAGTISRRVAELLEARASAAKIVGVISRSSLASPDAFGGAVQIASASQLAALAPDIVIEAASREAVREWGTAALQSARHFVVSSSSAFVDDALLAGLRDTARQCRSQIVLSPGAIAGMDALSAAARLPMREVRHRIVKSPRSWGALAADRTDVAGDAAVVLFAGSAREAANRYPLNANVTVVSAISGVGLDATTVELVMDPSVVENRHEIRAAGDFGTLTVTLENRPLQGNPKSSELAALALVRFVENRFADLVL